MYKFVVAAQGEDACENPALTIPRTLVSYTGEYALAPGRLLTIAYILPLLLHPYCLNRDARSMSAGRTPSKENAAPAVRPGASAKKSKLATAGLQPAYMHLPRRTAE